MHYKEISKILGNYLFYLALILCLPLGVAIYFQYVVEIHLNLQPDSSYAFFLSILICLITAVFFRIIGRKSTGVLHKRESIILVVLIWFITSVIGAFPYYLSNTLENPLDAYFETISGFTTTGASVMTPKAYDQTGKEIPIHVHSDRIPEKDYNFYGTITPVRDKATGKILFTGVEAVSKAILFWRNFTQWLGGMGIVVLFLTVLPALGVGGKSLYQLEAPGPIKEAISPRIKETASLLWKLYLGLTIIEIVLLLWGNAELPLFDAVSISLSNISTGGFSIRNDSIQGYHNSHTEWIILIFMILGSINFSLYFHCLRGKFYKIYVPDFFLFLGAALLGSIFVTYFLLEASSYDNLSTTIREGLFQTVSAQTSTGYVTSNYNLWPFASQMGMLLLMFVGGMSGSTCGGIKTPRFYILFKIVYHQIESIFRPDAVKKLRVEKSEITSKTAMTVMVFFAVVAFFTVLGSVLFILDGLDLETSIGLMACMINNIGIAFTAEGLNSFAFLSPFSKITSTFWMLLGRLEFYTVLILFLPDFWKGK